MEKDYRTRLSPRHRPRHQPWSKSQVLDHYQPRFDITLRLVQAHVEWWQPVLKSTLDEAVISAKMKGADLRNKETLNLFTLEIHRALTEVLHSTMFDQVNKHINGLFQVHSEEVYIAKYSSL